MRRLTVARATAVAVAAALVLSGCGRGGDAGTSDGAAGGPAPAGQASGEIQVWTAGGHADNLQKLALAWLEANPEASLTVTDVPWDQVITKLQTATAAGKGPDIIMTGADQTATAIGMGAFDELPGGVYDDSDFYPAAVDSVTGDKDVLYAMPWYVETRFLFYRKDIASQLGLSAPTTWEEMQKMAAAFESRPGGTYGLSLPRPTEQPAQVIVPFVAQAGGSMTDGKQWTIDTKEFISALDYYAGYFTRGEAPIEASTDATFENGGTPMFISGPWMLDIYKDQIEKGTAPAGFTMDSVGYAVAPKGPAGNGDQYIGGGNLGVFSASKNKASAWSLVSWMGKTQQQEGWYDLQGELPANTGAAGYQPIQDNPVTSTLMQQMNDTVATPNYPTWSQVSDLISKYSEMVARGTMSAADAAKEIQTKATAIGFGW
ncbi:extracellular solute-binding protein [Agromyces cerinus]|uniref:Carbohydrate ABC transporter substrate-binding protein, CUT1 family n=1 Tax=Agromyces cerinus subsp. cerinus TaxID=232089 RepID=A0A1N6G013_9MICO|nr:extracellular solute-binding protein [Agromyces cerinus]SIO00782.1 carbohydrate ABC transporter substrate-binding protein, CUT1 family [Agromyces cerinus subsp. cerinus]